MKLRAFNGGLNIRQAPELISPTEAVVCSNADISTGQLQSSKALGSTAITLLNKPYYFKANNEWMPNADTRDYTEYQGHLYWSDGATPQKYIGGTIYNLGIVKPSLISAALGAAGNLTGTIQYVYTYYNIADGTESAPSPISLEVVATAQNISVALTASTDPQVSHIFLYRVGGSLTQFTKVVELSNTSQLYTDDTLDSAVLGTLLSSEFNNEAPYGLQYLVEAAGVFFGAVGSKLYFTTPEGNPNYWPATNYINFHALITGTAVVAAGVIVFTYDKAYVITGTTAATFVKQPIDGSQGCINNKTIVPFSNTIMWLSTDGLCTLLGRRVEVTSKYKLGKQTYSAVVAVTHDETYYCQLTNKTILAFDLRYTPAFKEYDFATTWLVVANDKLYGETPEGSLELFQGDLATYEYETGKLTEGSATKLKLYKDIIVALEGTHTITVLIDDEVVITKEFTGSKKPSTLKVPQELQRGTAISFRLSGVGTIKEIDYDVSIEN